MKVIQFNSQITEIENINPLFSKVKIRIAATGANANGSIISKESFEKALPSIYNCPIIGEYFEETDSFGSHGGRVVIDSSGVKWEQTTQPYGLINDKTEITWETIIENGVEKQYLCATGYLWTGRYPELQQVIENSNKQSMEIEVKGGNFTEINGEKYLEITDFIFSGFCILGSVEPCFENAEIMAFSSDYSSFKNQFFEMINELKQHLNQTSLDVDINKEGGQVVKDFSKLFEQYSVTQEQTLDFDNSINFEEISEKDLELKIKEYQESLNKEGFALTAMQMRDILKVALNVNATKDSDGYTTNPYYYLDHGEEFVWAEDRDNNWNPVQFKYSLDGEIATIDFESKKMCKWQLVALAENEEFKSFDSERLNHEFEIKVKEIETNFNLEKEALIFNYDLKIKEIEEKYSKLESDYINLEEYKNNKISEERNSAETELFKRFSTQLTEEELNVVKENSSEFSLEELEEKLFVLIGKKSVNFSVKKDKGVKVILTNEESKPKKVWADLVN